MMFCKMKLDSDVPFHGFDIVLSEQFYNQFKHFYNQFNQFKGYAEADILYYRLGFEAMIIAIWSAADVGKMELRI